MNNPVVCSQNPHSQLPIWRSLMCSGMWSIWFRCHGNGAAALPNQSRPSNSPFWCDGEWSRYNLNADPLPKIRRQMCHRRTCADRKDPKPTFHQSVQGREGRRKENKNPRGRSSCTAAARCSVIGWRPTVFRGYLSFNFRYSSLGPSKTPLNWGPENEIIMLGRGYSMYKLEPNYPRYTRSQ